MKTFGLKTKGKIFNHRVPIKYQKFKTDLNPEEIVAFYSRDDYDKIDQYAGQRTYKDAQNSLGRKNFLLPNLSAQDLEVNDIFQQEMDRQRALIARVNKIRVVIDSIPGKDTELILDKDISTPYDCARHIHNLLTQRSVVAEILPLDSSSVEDTSATKQIGDSQSTVENALTSDSQIQKTSPKSIFWDMHAPLEDSCRIKLRHFVEDDVYEVNKTYWRSCSFVLGMAIRLAFKDEIKVLLHSWPKPNIRSGSFVYDAALGLEEKWQPSEKELRAFTKVMWNIKSAALPFERLRVSPDIARKLFANNVFKLTQIDEMISNQNSDKITVYRCGGLLDMSVGPMISNTNHIGRISLASVHSYETKSNDLEGVFYRFQGVSTPNQLPISSFLYQNILINQAKMFNQATLSSFDYQEEQI